VKIVLDTNVLIAATFWEGASAKVMEMIEQKKIRGYVSEKILNEYANSIQKKRLQIKKKELGILLSYAKLASITEKINPEVRYKVVLADPDDDKIIECAKAADADCILSYDHHLLDLKVILGVPVLTPEQFLSMQVGKPKGI